MINRRKANKPHVCTYSCGSFIKSRAIYLKHAVRDPGTKKLRTLNECSTCATRNGRAGLLEKR